MSVHQLKDGRWFVQYPDRLRPGKKKREYFGRGEKAEIKARKYNESLALKKQGSRKKDNHSAFFVDLVNEYAEARLAHIQESTLENFMYKMKGVILPCLGRIRAMNITPKRIDGYVKDRLKNVKKTTVHRELSDIRAVLNWAVRRRLIAFNPIEKYEMPKRDDDVILYPSEDEINAILRHSSERLMRAISISYYTGLRPGPKELYSMQWNHVDFKANTIMVKSAKKGSRYKYRLVPVHPKFTAVLRQWYEKDDSPNGFIIHYGKNKQPVKSLKKSFATAKKKAGITRRLRMYDFRHCFASLLLKNSADLKATSELLGHSRTETTTRIYQHTDFAMHQDAIRRLPPLAVGNPERTVTKIIPFKRRNIKAL
jgi:integrase